MRVRMLLAIAVSVLLLQRTYGSGARGLGDGLMDSAVGGLCQGGCDTLNCHNSACAGGSMTVGTGVYYFCNKDTNNNSACMTYDVSDCYTSYWGCTDAKCTVGCSYSVFRKPRACSDD